MFTVSRPSSVPKECVWKNLKYKNTAISWQGLLKEYITNWNALRTNMKLQQKILMNYKQS